MASTVRPRGLGIIGAMEVASFATRRDWQRWLSTNHTSSTGVWLRLAKKKSGVASVTYDEAIAVAISYGWIDGQKKPYDETYWLQRFTPRTARSKWSKINRAKAERLIATKQMRAAGLREVDRAKQDGRWAAAYEGQRTASVPPDLQQALDRSKRAREFFAALDSANRYAILYRVQDAKKPETRARRIETFVTMLSEGKKLHG
jgi:uncharacterized protein YdeI (YjbR/CyaY-like superfamily)